MSLSFNQKKTVVDEMATAIATAQVGVVAEYRGLTVAELTALRCEAHRQGVWVKVVKNNLAKRVVADSSFACLTEHFVGPVIFSVSEDAVAAARVMAKFAKDYDNLNVTMGAMQGVLIDRKTINNLAKLPSRDELIAQMMSVMRAPMQKLVTTLNEIPSKFVRTVSKIASAQKSA